MLIKCCQESLWTPTKARYSGNVSRDLQICAGRLILITYFCIYFYESMPHQSSMAFYSKLLCREPCQKGTHSAAKLLHEPELMHVKILLTVLFIFKKGL